MAFFAVFGLGSFGSTIALELSRLNHEVIGIDHIKKNVERISDEITHGVIADATDEQVLEELNIKNCDAVVVAIGENIEASILCVLHLKNMGISNIWVKAKTKSHHMILSHLDVKKIIHPEEDMGIRVAQALMYPMVSRYMALNNDHFIVKTVVPQHLNQINLVGLLEKTEEIHFILLQTKNEFIYQLHPDQVLHTEDILIIEGPQKELKKLSQKFL